MSKEYPRNIFPSLPRTARGIPIVLGGDPKGRTFLYTNRNSVIIRDIDNPAVSDIYTEHSYQCIVAKYAPSGFYIASGDVSGKVRIWDTTQREHLLKYEYQPISGTIKDIAWSPDSKRVAVGGQGRENYAHVFLWDSGSSVGELHGHSKAVNSVDYRPERPYRIATASEDYTVGWYNGPPFKYQRFISDHKNFVNCVRFDPTGRLFMSGGADGKIFIYDGKTGELIGELGSPSHRAGVYALSFSQSGDHVLTASADKTAKIWDTNTSQLITEFKMGYDLADMQVSCLWQGEHLLTVSLSGFINYLDRNKPDKPIRILKGHNHPITALTPCSETNKFFTGSSDSRICQWDQETGLSEVVEGKGHENQVQDMLVRDEELVTISVDDTIRFTPESSLTYGTDVIKLDSQPKSLAHSGDRIVVVCVDELVVIEQKKKVFTLKVKYEPVSVDVNPAGTEVAVGADREQKVFLYSLEGNTLNAMEKTLSHQGGIMDLKYSPSGEFLAVVDGNRRMKVYDASTYEMVGREGLVHNAKIMCVNWSPDSRQLCMGSLDTGMSVWQPEKCELKKHIKGAHALSSVGKVCWLDDHTVVSAGSDCALKLWTID